MLVKHHCILAVVLFFGVYYKYGNVILSLIAALASILIDFDHYLAYVIKTKDFSLRDAIHWYSEETRFVPLIFHSVYFITFMLAMIPPLHHYNITLFSLGVYDVWVAIFVGIMYHLFCDILWDLINILIVEDEEDKKKKTWAGLINKLLAVRIKGS